MSEDKPCRNVLRVDENVDEEGVRQDFVHCAGRERHRAQHRGQDERGEWWRWS